MKRQLLIAVLVAFHALAGIVAAPIAKGATNVNAIVDEAGTNDTTSPQRQQPEPSIAINRRNVQVIAAGAQDFRRATELRAGCGGERWNALYLSTDGGANWTNSLVPGYCTDATQGQGSDQAVSEMFGYSTNTDPVLVFDDFGNLYYSHIAFNANPFRTVPPSASGVLFVSTYRVSDEGAATYAKTVKVPSGSGLRKTPFEVGPGINSNFDDKQWMTVDNSASSPFYGRVYVTWTKFDAQGGQSSIWVSHCGGEGPGDEVCHDFARGRVLNKPVAGGLVQESFPGTAPDGTLYIAFLQFQGGFGSTLPHSGIWILKSTDGGETAVQHKITDIQQIPSPIPPAGTAANDGFNSFRTGTAPGVAVTSDGTVHVVWGEWVGGTNAEVRYTRSTDGGSTWSAPISVNSDPTGHQFFPSITASGETVHVAWYDGRFNPAGTPITALQVFYGRLTNAGDLLTEMAVTTQPFNPNQVSRFPVFCAAFIGDYIDIDAVGDTVAVIWNDNRDVTVPPLSPAECQDFRTRPTDPAIQSRLDGGALDQEAFVAINP
jgi:hypothetical protein